MNLRDFVIDLVAATPYDLGARGRYFGIIDCAGGIDVQLDSGAPLLRGAGGSLELANHFDRVTLTSPTTQTVRVLVAEERQDITNIVTAAPAAPLVVEVQEAISDTVATPAPVTVADADAETIAANPDRLRLTVCAHEDNAGPIYLQAVAAGAARGIPIAPGTFVEVRTVVALDVRNDTGADADFSIFEEE